jgi:3-oxoacyl-[acyl-carrier protein] reductase
MSNPASSRKTAFISGTSGISAAIAEQFADELGYNGFILLYRSDKDRAEALVKKLLERSEVRDVVLIQHDISTASGCVDAVEAIFSVINERFGGQITSVIHSGGCFLPKGDSDFEGYFNLYPRFFKLVVDRVLPLMPDEEGRIIAISAGGSNLSISPRVTYTPGPAKAMLEQLVRVYAKREAKRRITSNTVIPGITITPIWKKLVTPEVLESRIAERCPMNLPIMPSDIANTVVFLCSPKGKFITGAFLPVDGGMHFKE